MRWIAVHLPLLSLESFMATLPEAGDPLAPQPVVLLDPHRVAAVNAAAAQAGIRLGHRRATAVSLAPTLVMGEADPARDEAALQAVAHAALAFTPSVLWRPPKQLVLLEVASCLRYWGGLQRLAQRLRQALQPLGHALRWATAPTAPGAALLARVPRRAADAAAARAGQAESALAQRLDALPVDLLDVDPDTVSALHGMGLRTLAQLKGVPRAGLARRFGDGLLKTLDQAYGRVPAPTEAWLQLPPVFDSRLELFHLADNTEQVLQGAAVLLQRLVAWARGRHARVASFVLRMHHEPRHREGRAVPAHSALHIALAQPSADAAHLHLLLKERLARTPLAAPTLELSLHCDDAPPGAPPNAELFASRADEREGLVRLIERLQSRLGELQVLQLHLRSDHRMECSTVAQPARAADFGSGLCAVPQAPSMEADGQGLRLTRPAWLLPQPQPLAAGTFGPLLEGRPLKLVAGPERLETGWWDPAPVRRDYYVAQTPAGQLLWVYLERPSLNLDAQTVNWQWSGCFG